MALPVDDCVNAAVPVDVPVADAVAVGVGRGPVGYNATPRRSTPAGACDSVTHDLEEGMNNANQPPAPDPAVTTNMYGPPPGYV